jgi:hypothetical protein
VKNVARALSAAVLVGGLLFSSAPVAGAHVVPSSITFGVSDRTVRPHQRIFFFGDLHTPGHPRCHVNALIVLRRVHTGIVATTRTDAQGTFAFRIDPRPNHGRYYAHYRGRSGFGYLNSHGCLASNSRVIRIRRA